MKTPRYDSKRRRDRLHLWALRTGRRTWRRLPGVSAAQARDRQRRMVHLQVSRWVDGEFVDGEVQTFMVDADSIALHQDVTACTFDGEIFTRRYTTLLRLFGDDPRLVGYKAGQRPDEPPAHDWPVGKPPIPEGLRGLAEHRAEILAKRRRRQQTPMTVEPRDDVL